MRHARWIVGLAVASAWCAPPAARAADERAEQGLVGQVKAGAAIPLSGIAGPGSTVGATLGYDLARGRWTLRPELWIDYVTSGVDAQHTAWLTAGGGLRLARGVPLPTCRCAIELAGAVHL